MSSNQLASSNITVNNVSNQEAISTSKTTNQTKPKCIVEDNTNSFADNLLFLSACLTLTLVAHTGWTQASRIGEQVQLASKNIVHQIVDLSTIW